MNDNVSDILLEISKIKKATGSNAFSVGAYVKASQFVRLLSVPINTIDLENTKGIGPKIAGHIKEYLSTGKIQYIEDNKQHLTSSFKIDELLKVEGIGEKTAIKIQRELSIFTIEQLKASIADNSISSVLGDKMILKVKKGLEYLDKTKGRIRLDEAIILVRDIFSYVSPYVLRIDVGGSFRRSTETVGDIDIAIIPKNEEDSLRVFEQMPIVDSVIDSGEKKSSIWIKGVRVDCYAFSEKDFESGLMHLTGSADHNKRLREIAISKGLILSQYGLYKRNGNERTGDRLDNGTEKDIYKLLGLHWVPPEHRSGQDEIQKYKLDQNIITLLDKSNIVGDYHIHSTWSDGKSSIEEIVNFAISQDLEEIAITDHSQSLKIAKGLSINDLLKRNKEIDILRVKYPMIKILKGSEVDIKSDGSLDYPDEILDQLDFVIASIHTNTQKDVTETYVKAIQTGKVHTIGHIIGRIINEREGHLVDVETVLQACKQNNVAIELNCQPNRLDANEMILKRCKSLGVKISLGSDAHEKNQIIYVKTFGLWMSKRAWLTVDNIFKK
jgi:DNA polymerase (family 10)